MKKLHETQVHIITTLLLNPSMRYSQLCPEGMTTDHFNFHMKKMIQAGYVYKSEVGEYLLTTVGKEFANRFDVDSGEIKYETQAKIGVLVAPVRTNENGETEYLIQKRLKQPFYGYHGFLGGKLKYGEFTHEGAARELEEEAGLVAEKLILTEIEHRRDVDAEGEILEDKFFYVYRAEGCSGELMEKWEQGENFWMTRQEIENIPADEKFNGMMRGVDSIDATNRGLIFDEFQNEPLRY